MSALVDMIQGLNEQHTIGCSSLEEDGSGCDCCLPAAAAFLGLLRDRLNVAEAERDAARSSANGLRSSIWTDQIENADRSLAGMLRDIAARDATIDTLRAEVERLWAALERRGCRREIPE